MAAGTGRKKGGIPLLADGLKDKDIIKCALYGTDLPVLPLGEYAQEQLQEVALKLIEFSRNLLLGNIGISTDLQEHLDSMKFKAGKDSTTSSMKPSSDLFRKNPPSSCDNDDDSKTASSHKGLPTDKGADNPRTPGDEADSEKKLRADRDRSLRTPSGTKPGRHNGETGKGFRKPENIHSTEEEVILPDKCMGCPHKDSCMGAAQLGVRHNIYDIEIHIVQKTVRTSEVNCPMDGGKPQKSDYPEEAKGVNQYGINIQTLICLLYCIGMVSLNRIRSIVSPLLGIQLSETTILKYVNRLADKVKGTVDAILEAQKDLPHVHCDETGATVNGKNHWIHCVATELYTFVSLQAKRGKEGMDVIGFLAEYTGTVIHDCWCSYWSYDEENDQLRHSVCNAHILRELNGLVKFFHNANLWAADMSSLLREILHAKHEAQDSGMKCFDTETIALYFKRYDELISRGKELHPAPERRPGQRGRLKKGRARSLIDRMELRKDDILRFLTDFDIPFDNNEAERSFRLLGTKKGVGIFRTLDNAQNFCLVWSYLATAHKHKITYYDAIREALLGNSMEMIFPKNTPKNTSSSTDDAA